MKNKLISSRHNSLVNPKVLPNYMMLYYSGHPECLLCPQIKHPNINVGYTFEKADISHQRGSLGNLSLFLQLS